MKFWSKAFSVIMSTILILSFTPVYIYARPSLYVYHATIKNGSEDGTIGGVNSARFGYATLDFLNGKIILSTRLNSSFKTQGKEYFYLPPSGEEFVFDYTVNTQTGEVGVCINNEVVARAVYSNAIGSNGIRPSSPSWELVTDKYDATSTADSFKLSDVEIFNPSQQSMEISGGDTASIALEFKYPISDNALLNFKISDGNNTQIPLADAEKSRNSVILFTQNELTPRGNYRIELADSQDIYGNDINLSVSFVPETKGELRKGADVVPNQFEKEVMGFELQTPWRTESNLTLDNGFLESELLIDSLTYQNQSYGAILTSQRKAQGNYSIKWSNHPYYSTLGTNGVPRNFTGANLLSFWAYSEEATNETVMVTLYSDNDKTPWKDGYTYPLKIDWVGEKRVAIPLRDFNYFQNPKGFHSIDGLYFHTKMYDLTPNPYTVLYLDDITITYDIGYPISIKNKCRQQAQNHHDSLFFDYETLNHRYDETTSSLTSPIEYKPYYKTERALSGYYPKYNPALPSFDTNGNAYLKFGATHIQYLGSDNTWKVLNLEPYLESFLLEKENRLQYEIYDGGSNEDSVIRFDTEGGVYVTMTVSGGALLFYSPDSMQCWQVYRLPSYYARFERIEANNKDAALSPPVILLHSGSKRSEKSGYMLFPEKKADKTLDLSHIVEFSDNCISVAANSGDANMVITKDGMAFVVYGDLNPNPGVPQNHPALDLSYKWKDNTFFLKYGVPTFIRSYDIKTRVLSQPVFIGFGGREIDEHNWPGITIDSSGRLHAVINGHHDPVYYTYSINPLDISQWSQPKLIGLRNTYASLVTDKDDTMYITTRNSERSSRMDLVLYRKKAGADWEDAQYIAKRDVPYYSIWRNRMSYNPVSGDLYINYYSQSSKREMYKDSYDAFIYTWPDRERELLNYYINGEKNNIPVGTNKIPAKIKYSLALNGVSGLEPVLLRSDNGGESFHAALSQDFINMVSPPVLINDVILKRDGKQIDDISPGGVDLSVEISNSGDALSSAVIVIAAYKNNCLYDVILEAMAVPAGNFDFEKPIIIKENTDRIKIFIIESTGNLKPLCKPWHE